jgi:hypothetical protein
MDMSTAARTLEKAGNQYIGSVKNRSADRAYPFPAPSKAVNTAANMHEPVFSSIQGGEGRGAYQLSTVKLRGTHRANLGVAGRTLALRFYTLLFFGAPSPGENTQPGKKCKTEPEQGDPDNHKSQNFYKLFHYLPAVFFAPV